MGKTCDVANWICFDCAEKHGGTMPADHLCTMHIGICDVCQQEKTVTEPRDFIWEKASAVHGVGSRCDVASA